MQAPDAFDTLLSSKRPLVLGIGGGGDVVGALGIAELLRRYRGAEPLLGGISWERLPVDPQPGPRRAEEIEGATRVADGVLLAGPDTRVRGTEIRFSESRMSEFLGQPTVLLDISGGPVALAGGLCEALRELDRDALVMVDVGGDVLAHGDEPGLGSPLCDAVLLAAGVAVADAGWPVVGAVFGSGCDGELTIDEISDRVSELGAAGALSGALGLTTSVAGVLEAATAEVITEASALPIRALRGERGEVEIRGGRRRVWLTPAAALTIFFDPGLAVASAARLARAVADAASLEEANAILNARGVGTELDWEREAAARAAHA